VREEYVLRMQGASGRPIRFTLSADGAFALPGRPAVPIKILRHDAGGLLTVLWGDRVVSGVVTREPGNPGLLQLTACATGSTVRQTFVLRSAVADELERGAAPGSPLSLADVLISPISGLVKRVLVKVHDRVTAGQTLIVLEAMKMENELAAPHSGTVTALHVNAGQVVAAGTPLAKITGSTHG